MFSSTCSNISSMFYCLYSYYYSNVFAICSVSILSSGGGSYVRALVSYCAVSIFIIKKIYCKNYLIIAMVPLSITLSVSSSARLPNLLNLLFSQFHIRLSTDTFATGPCCKRAYGFYTLYPLLSCLVIIRFIDIFYYEKNIY